MNDLSSSPPFVVTGASGYVASWVVWELLNRGATVRGTVRNPNDTTKCQHLLDMAAELPGTLKLAKADLLEAGSFDEAVAGAGVVIHTASPFIIGKVKEPYRQLINPAVEGTKNVLDAVNKAESVKKVVLTSTALAVYGDAQDMANAGVDRFTEDDWNTTSSASHQAYSFSKTEAERAAWEMHKAQSRWTLATINPGFILGPSKTPRADSESVKFVRGMLRGEFKMGAPDLWFGVVDVRDVAKAHVEAAIRPEVEGRFILVADSKNFVEMGQILRNHFGDKYPFPKGPLPKFLFYLAGPSLGFTWKFIRANSGYPVYFDNTRSRERLGIQYTPVEETLVQHAEQLIAAHSHKET
ncbi:MAG: NAD-dependent epimerase/dehydratase family protein [Myxococcales bacterium]|nr:NAD-dependent epimerase/dehydratase family protein [Myxococcales bacterium]MDH3842958.1 NAD-dependent epimerase/dehydratase family protein [Myxococcales bacterium]